MFGKECRPAPSQSITIAEAANNWIKRVEADARERSTLNHTSSM